MRILTPLLIVILWLVLLLTGALKAEEVLYDLDGNPMTIPESEVPAEPSQPIPINVPAMEIPKIVLPVVHIPKLIIPSVAVTYRITPADIMQLYDPADTDVATTTIATTDVATTSIATHDNIALPNTDPADTDVATTTMATHGNIALPNTDQTVASVAARMKQWERFLADGPDKYIRDKRTLKHSKGFNPDNPAWAAWQLVYAQEYPRIKHVPAENITELKMLAEMRKAETPAAIDNLIEELKYFKGLGYNGVLAIWEGEEPFALLQQIVRAKALGYKVWFAYGKREKLQDDVFIAPDVLQRGLSLLASVCDGYVIGWRRTSIHLFNADDQYYAATINWVRQGNPDIRVFGEAYYGYQGNNNPDGSYNETEFTVRVPENASGVVVINFGRRGIRPDGVRNLLRQYTNVPLVALVVGERPYYLTRNLNNKTKEENRQIITSIEERFRRAGFGTATLAGDGSNEIYNPNVSDDLCKSQWSKQ